MDEIPQNLIQYFVDLKYNKNKNWREKYIEWIQFKKEQICYEDIMRRNKRETPPKPQKGELPFNPYTYYSKSNKFVELNFKNLILSAKTMFFYDRWWFFFLLPKYISRASTWTVTNHSDVERSIRRRLVVLFITNCFFLSLLPILLQLIFCKIGLTEFYFPYKKFSVQYFLLVAITLLPIFFSTVLVDYFVIFHEFFACISVCIYLFVLYLIHLLTDSTLKEFFLSYSILSFCLVMFCVQIFFKSTIRLILLIIFVVLYSFFCLITLFNDFRFFLTMGALIILLIIIFTFVGFMIDTFRKYDLVGFSKYFCYVYFSLLIAQVILVLY